MALKINKLTARTVATLNTPGRHSDGAGLYLQVSPRGAKSWLFMHKSDGRRREIGLGSARDVSLAAARESAATLRKAISEGRDPLVEKRAAEANGENERANITTFGEFADELITSIEGEFRNEKHRAQWRMTLSNAYCKKIRGKAITDVDTQDILEVLTPVWQKKAETASRVRGRIERVLDAAKAKGLRNGENPARWRGHLDALLPKRQKLQRGHHKAMPYDEVPAFLVTLRKHKAVASGALEFTILLAARSGEVLNAAWDEMDLSQNIWTIPAERMKAGREHRVPLVGRSLRILSEMTALHGMENGEIPKTGYVFPGQKSGRPLSGMAMTMLLRRMKIDVTVHGFRSSFRDWVGEETNFPRELAEGALAHVVGDETERAYRRRDALEKRRALMDTWDRYCTGGD